MSAIAEQLNPTTGQWELVCAANLTEDDRKYTYRCSCCKTPVCLAIGTAKENYFVGFEHQVDCSEAKGHKIIHMNTATKINLTAILEYEDHEVQRGGAAPAPQGPDGSGDPEGQEDGGEDFRLDPNGTRTIFSTRGMFAELAEKHRSAAIDDFTMCEVDSFFLRRDTLRSLKDNWGCSEKLVVAKRFLREKLEHNIPVPKGYVLLRDAYSMDDEDAIYFLVKMKHPEQDKLFKEKLFGKKPENGSVLIMGEKTKRVGKDPHKHIAIFARWKRVKHSHYRIYKAELNSRMVAFVNAPDA